jgi:hypothetical protein
MRIDQRNGGVAQTITAASPSYSVDRFIVRPVGGTVTGQRVAGTGSTQYVYQITGGASVTQLQFEQRIESSNSYDLAGSDVTISANISNSLLTTASWILYYANVTDNFSANTLISSGNWTVSSTISRYSATVAVPAGATTGLYLMIVVGSQTSGTLVIGDVQLEKGSTATEFERRPIGTELSLCQRYYENNYPPSSAVGSNSGNAGCWFGVAINSFDFYDYGRLNFLVTKRTNPIVALYNPITGGGNFQNLSTNTLQGNSVSRLIGINSASMNCSNNALVGGIAYSTRYTADAEL